ncbi:hypothetical protein [Pedobacter aquatilis]|uniref:hypothetical protein n=1 Tax=Pedobacter aquatilis TaxID=351343 RepID=UPI00292DCCB7|nr:hypothetical protein [Pedobacter aquatilis]
MFKSILEKFNKVMKFKAETFTTEKIKDSEQSLEFPELVVDAEVFISTPNGSEPAPDGSYTLANGAEIKVADGKIAEVVKEPQDEPEVEVEAAKEDEEVKVEDAPVAEEAIDEDKEALLAEIESLKAEIAKLKEGFAAYPTKSDLEKFQSDFTAELKKLEAIPTQFSQTDNRVELADNPMAKYLAMAEKAKK